ncbi:MAG: hypothetical protein JXO22_14305 [Phycisphaerae bacterium]|nr:hypothetical protein [Phycisphaerae bacterium]
MDERTRQRQFEDQFLAQLRARAQALVGRGLPARNVHIETMPDGDQAVRDRLARLEVWDRDVLEQMPGRRSLQMRFVRPRLGGLLQKTVARLRVQPLVAVDELIANETPGPIGREAVLDALARFDLLPTQQRPTAVVLASATGFTPEAKSLVDAGGQPTLILMGGRLDGGWDTALPESLHKSPWAKLFELETQDARLRRLLSHLNESGMELGSRGVPLTELAQQIGLPLGETETLVRQACRQDPRLMTVVHEGKINVCRSPLADEGKPMSMWSWIRKLLRRKPSAAEQVRELTAQRVRLEQQRHEIDQQVDTLETQERDLLKQGAAAPSAAEKRQVAGKLMRMRRELKRQRTRAQMFSQQIDVLGTQIHHVTLTAQSKQVQLPSAEELAQQAAQAEQVMTDLAASADLAHNVEVEAGSPLMQEEEEAIFAEFDQVAAHDKSSTADTEMPVAEAGDVQVADAPPAVPRRKDEPARPELG